MIVLPHLLYLLLWVRKTPTRRFPVEEGIIEATPKNENIKKFLNSLAISHKVIKEMMINTFLCCLAQTFFKVCFSFFFLIMVDKTMGIFVQWITAYSHLPQFFGTFMFIWTLLHCWMAIAYDHHHYCHFTCKSYDILSNNFVPSGWLLIKLQGLWSTWVQICTCFSYLWCQASHLYKQYCNMLFFNYC